MATFTSVSGGNWNVGATWGKSDPPTKGTDYPGIAGDVVNIGTTANQSHVVIYNVSETNELGQVTVGATSGSGASKLEFATGMSTKITLGTQDILVQATGEVRGQAGAIIPAAYACELVWNTISDYTKGINISAGGKFNLSGDPAYYGSKYNYLVATQVIIPAAGNAVTVSVLGNYQSNFVGGQELLIHKGGTYASYINDFARLAVVSAANNGINTDISCTVTERPTTLTCIVGADLLNVSRNVSAYKLGYNNSLGQTNSNRPRLANANVYGSNNININDVSFGGWFVVVAGYSMNFNGVIRNSYYGITSSYFCNIGGIVFSSATGIQSGMGNYLSAIFCNNYTAVYSANKNTFTGNMYGNFFLFIVSNNIICSGNLYSNYEVFQGMSNCIIKGNIGYNTAGIVMANTIDLSFYNNQYATGVIFSNSLTPTSLAIDTRNTLVNQGRFSFENYRQVLGVHHITDAFGDLDKVSSGWTGTPPSNSSNCIKMSYPQTNVGVNSPLEIIFYQKFKVWQKAGTVVYRVYIQAPTGNNSNYAAADLVFYAEYLSAVSPIATNVANSTGSITRANDWTQYLTVTVASAADGWVTLYLRLMKYYAAGDVFYVDPGIWAGGNILLGDWSGGELVYPGPAYFGGGGNPALFPLGVMEAVQ